MKNPWIEIKENHNDYLNSKNFILNDDRDIIEEFNLRNKHEKFKIHKNILPFPYLGNVNNPQILILVNNPGFDNKEFKNGFYGNFHEEIIASYEGNKPMYCFDDDYIKFSDYWFKKLKSLISQFSKEEVSKKIGIINYFPYSSEKFKDFTKKEKSRFLVNGYLKSQEYNFELIRNAIISKTLIIIVRGKNNWFSAIPELKEYENTFSTNSYLNSSISENNCTGFYDKILKKFNHQII